MHTRARRLLVGAVGALVLATAVGSASANRFSFSNRSFRSVWSSVSFEAGGTTVRCPVTFEGSFHSATLQKVVGALVGFISRATAATGSCTGGRVTVQQETLPWHLTYTGFEGTLPNITHVNTNMANATYRVEFGTGTPCTVRTSGGKFLLTLDANGVISVTINYFAPVSGGGLCEVLGEAHVEAAGTPATLPGSATRITVTLI